jgi:hypothetical protein
MNALEMVPFRFCPQASIKLRYNFSLRMSLVACRVSQGDSFLSLSYSTTISPSLDTTASSLIDYALSITSPLCLLSSILPEWLSC